MTAIDEKNDLMLEKFTIAKQNNIEAEMTINEQNAMDAYFESELNFIQYSFFLYYNIKECPYNLRKQCER